MKQQSSLKKHHTYPVREIMCKPFCEGFPKDCENCVTWQVSPTAQWRLRLYKLILLECRQREDR